VRTISTLLIALLLSSYCVAQRKKKGGEEGTPLPTVQPDKKKKKKSEEEEVTQTLPVLKDPPAAIQAETRRLRFLVTPLSGKGLLSQQTRDALKSLLGQTRGSTVVKLRAFISGVGDLRRIPTIVSETFTEKRLNLPALSVIQVGALPLDNAQVVFEAALVDKKVLNPHGVAFFSGQQAPAARQSLEQLQTAVRGANVKPADILRVTCFLSSLDDAHSTRTAVSAAYPAAALNIVQLQRAAVDRIAECEAVGRLSAPAKSVEFLNPAGLTPSPNYSQVALVSTEKLVFSGIQMAFHDQENDIRLAFDRLGKAIEPMGAGFKNVVMVHAYPLTRSITEKYRAVRFNYYDKTRPPASTLLLFEGLPSLDASVAVEVIAALP
jgi:enamine deaminase RidA (YjgF/YER057c/UK114 family)